MTSPKVGGPTSGGNRSRRRQAVIWGAVTSLALVAAVVVAVSGAGVGADREVPPPPTGGSGPTDGNAAAGAAAEWPREPPARICGNDNVLGGGPTTPPAGAVTIPSGDNSSLAFTLRQPNTTFWFAPGVHTLGSDEFGQIIPGNGSTYVGAPGAVIDGNGVNRYAFTGESSDVTIRYLTVQNFVAPVNEGTVNHGFGSRWLVEYTTIRNNAAAGLMAGGPDNTYRYNCLQNNGQYGVNACCGTPERPTTNLVLDRNEIAGNNTGDWERRIEGCGCTGGVKFWINADVTVTNNWVHDNKGVGLWLDNNNSGFVIEGNYVQDNDSHALMLEAGYDASVRRNNFTGNALVSGRKFKGGGDTFPIAAIYVSEDGSPEGYGLKSVPTVISDNNFANNWGGVALWESPDRYCGSSAHTHPPFCTIKEDLRSDAGCKSGVPDVIPPGIDKYNCRWSTENVVVENNDFTIDKAAIGQGCAGEDFCGLNGLFGGYGTLPAFPAYEIPWRVTFQQDNVFRNNRYVGDWKFAGFLPSITGRARVGWQDWTAPAPAIPPVFTDDNMPTTFGQDRGSTFN